MRIGVIANPRSRRNLKALPAVRAVAAGYPQALYRELGEIGALATILREFAEGEIETIAVIGGDGTVQALVTELVNGGAFAQRPKIAVIAGGMTNLIGRDVGLAGQPAAALARLLAAAAGGRPLEIRRRAALSVRRGPGEKPILGFFLGTAAFYHGTLLGRAKIHPLGVQQGAAAGLAIAYFLLRAIFSRGGREQWAKGEAIGLAWVDAAGAHRETRRQRFVLLATTLEKLMLGLMPFWSEGDAALRLTMIDHPAQRLGAALWPLIRGRPSGWMEAAGYRSFRAKEVTLELDCPMMIDGEALQPIAGQTVVLGQGEDVEFVVA